ncbi:50S ribosomal protein L11 methyltransferase [Sorangium sp. So ce1128]
MQTRSRPGYTAEQVWLPASENILSWDEAFHELMLKDGIRMTAFKAAIDEAVRPGMVVLDLGTGTGILAEWALRAGAERVYGIELRTDVLSAAVEAIGRAGVGHRFFPVNELSYRAHLPERVDLIISEIMGNLADNEDCIAILNDARARFLKTDGQMLPRAVESYLVPVAAESAHERVVKGECEGLGGLRTLEDALQQSGARSRFDIYYDAILPCSIYLATPRVIRIFRLDGTDEPTYEHSTEYAVTTDGCFTGFKGYFIASLSRTVPLDISGDDIAGGATSGSWKHGYLPIEAPVSVKRGDRIQLEFGRRYPDRSDSPFTQVYFWRGHVVRDGRPIASFEQCTRGEPRNDTLIPERGKREERSHDVQ